MLKFCKNSKLAPAAESGLFKLFKNIKVTKFTKFQGNPRGMGFTATFII